MANFLILDQSRDRRVNMSWTYEQKTGKLFHNGGFSAQGYSGFGEGRNNPSMQDHVGLGPLPCGIYTGEVIKDESGEQCDYEGKAKPVIRLHPAATNQMFGRAGFLIHGDSRSAPGTASQGCMIEAHDERVYIARMIETGDDQFEVVSQIETATA
jgi:hypothetical protein